MHEGFLLGEVKIQGTDFGDGCRIPSILKTTLNGGFHGMQTIYFNKTIKNST
jgi:hypothetical protein